MAGSTGVFWLLLLAATLSYVISVAQYGPYNLHVTQLETCKDEGTAQIHFENRISFVGNGKHVYRSPFSILVPVDENFTVKVDAQKWSGQGWRPKAYVQTIKGCKAIEGVAGKSFKTFFKATGFNNASCPYPTGNFTANDWELELDLDIKMLFYGKYKVELNLLYNNIKVGCMNMYLDVIPKRNI